MINLKRLGYDISYRDINAIKGRVEGMFAGVGKLKAANVGMLEFLFARVSTVELPMLTE